LDTNCLDTILDRRSILKFKDDDIPQDVLDKVLHAALRASGPGGTLKGGYRGSQPYSIIEVRDPERRAQLNELLCEGRRPCIEKAPVSLVFCVDTHRMNRWSELQGGAPHFTGIGILWVALRGVYTAAQNAVIAAESLGLGSQYIQEIVWQPYTTLSFFQLPKQVLPVAMLILGYPEERPSLAPSLPLEAIVHKEVYSDPSDEEMAEHFASKEKYFQDWFHSLPEDSKLRRHIESKGITNLAQWVSILTYTESFYKWRDDAVRTNLHLSELE
jgi:FMN reductase (NADPH)